MGDQSGSPTSEPNEQVDVTVFEFHVCSRCGNPPSEGPCIMGNAEHAETWPKPYVSALIFGHVNSLLTVERERRQRAEEDRDGTRGDLSIVEHLLAIANEATLKQANRADAAERERDEWKRRALDYHRALSKGYGVEDGGVWEDRALAAEARAQRLAEALEFYADACEKVAEAAHGRSRS